MFKRPNRNLRVRKAESSGDEDEERSQPERPRRLGGRGLTCGTKKRTDEKPDTGDPSEQNAPPARVAGAAGLLSFTEEREGEDVAFKIKKPAVNAVLFQAQKQTENAPSPSKPSENDSGDGSHSEIEDGNPENMDCDRKEESPGSASSSTSPAESFERSQTGEIPDAKQIRAARRRRKLARAKGNFISLDVSQDASDSSRSESDSELDDHEKRITFAPGVKTIKEQMAEEMLSSSSNSDSGSHEDDSLQDGWEEQQMRKAVKHPQIISENLLLGGSPHRVKKHAAPKISTPQVTLEDIKNRLATRMASVQEVHRSHVLDNKKHERDLEDSKNTLEKLEKTTSQQSYKFFKKMKMYVETFVDCLNEKILQINEMEAEMFQILEDQARALLKRRQDILLNESAAILKLSGNGVASDTDMSDNAEQNLLQACELRRNKRRRAREEARQVDHHEGMSSDDELPTDQENDLQSSRESIVVQCKVIFEDVDEDFCRIKNVLSKFNEWRVRFPESYYDAYISLCLHKILNPLVRLQLVGWNPMQDVTELDKMAWYCDIEEFCFSKDEHENDLEENADHKVLSAVVEKIVVPKVSGFVEHVWDPLSSKQTDRLVCFCKTHVLENESSKMVKGLMVCLESRLKKAIEDDVYIPLYNKRLLEDRDSPHAKFRERQFWSAVKLLGNVVLWDGFLDEETLQELALDKLLNRYLLLVLLNAQPNSYMVTKCSKIVECLPQSWFKGLESGTSLARLSNFSKHLQKCVHALHKLNDRNSMEVMVSLLMKVKAQNYADEVVNKYSLGQADTS